MRKLTLNRERLAELGDADLAEVAGGTVLTYPCTLYPTWYGGVTGCLKPLLADTALCH